MNNAYGVLDGLPQVCYDTRQPVASVLTLIAATLAEMGLLDHGRTGELVPGNGSVRPSHGTEVMDG